MYLSCTCSRNNQDYIRSSMFHLYSSKLLLLDIARMYHYILFHRFPFHILFVKTNWQGLPIVFLQKKVKCNISICFVFQKAEIGGCLLLSLPTLLELHNSPWYPFWHPVKHEPLTLWQSLWLRQCPHVSIQPCP